MQQPQKVSATIPILSMQKLGFVQINYLVHGPTDLAF